MRTHLSHRLSLLAALCAASVLGSAGSASAATYSNPNPVTIGGGFPPIIANPYPSEILVTGITGTITDVNLRLLGYSDGTPDDLSVALQAPSGDTLLAMGGAGDATDAANVNLTIDDAAAGPLPNSGALATGTYRPAAYYTDDSFPAPGPGGGACRPAPHGTCTLASVFNGESPHGAWKLFAYDAGGTDPMTVSSWSLEITTDGVIDTTAPETTIDSAPAAAINRTTASFSFSASEAGSFDCRLDGGGFAPCGSPLTLSGLTTGEHRFEVRATDAAANVDESPAAHDFFVDLKAPEVGVDRIRVKAKRRRATVEFSGGDDGGAKPRYTCAIDRAEPKECSSPLTLKRLRYGKHSVTIVPTDRAGNVGDAAVAKLKLKRRRR